jgi:hypothetical protein
MFPHIDSQQRRQALGEGRTHAGVILGAANKYAHILYVYSRQRDPSVPSVSDLCDQRVLVSCGGDLQPAGFCTVAQPTPARALHIALHVSSRDCQGCTALNERIRSSALDQRLQNHECIRADLHSCSLRVELGDEVVDRPKLGLNRLCQLTARRLKVL